MLTYHQHAAGEFEVDVVPGTPHCGVDQRRGHFRYVVDIIYHDGALDSNGFLLDNTSFRQYFDSLGPVSISCEQLARRSCEELIAQLGERKRYVMSASVSIVPFGEVYVEALESDEETQGVGA